MRDADYELDRVDAIVSGAERVTGRVDAASGLADRVITSPVVKAMAVGTGTRRAVQRLTGNDKPPKRERKSRLRARTESRLGPNGRPAPCPNGRRARMFKRVTWLTVGFGLGVGTTVAAAREVRKQVDRYQPNALVDRGVDGLGAVARPARRRRRHRPRGGTEREAELRDAQDRLHRSTPLRRPLSETAALRLLDRSVRRPVPFVPWRHPERLTSCARRSPASSLRAATRWCRRRA